MKFTPIADRLLVEPMSPADISAGGIIIIPEIAKKKQNIGIVAAVGDNDVLAPGDTILFAENAGVEHSEGGKNYRIIRDRDVWLKFETLHP
ncbi:MAG: co-chaperone GroES [Chitinophagaceae bacterium]